MNTYYCNCGKVHTHYNNTYNSRCNCGHYHQNRAINTKVMANNNLQQYPPYWEINGNEINEALKSARLVTEMQYKGAINSNNRILSSNVNDSACNLRDIGNF